MRSQINNFTAYRVDLPLSTRHLLLLWSLWLIGCWLITLGTGPQAEAPRLMILGSMIGMMLIWPAFRLSQRRIEAINFSRDDQLTMQKTTSLFNAQPMRPPEPIVQEDLEGVVQVRTVSESGGDLAGENQRVNESTVDVTIMASVLMDWMALVVVFQAVVIPLHLIADWSIAQTLVANAVLVSWSMVASVFVAWGSLGRGEWSRSLAMLACVVVVLVGPAAMWLTSNFVSRGMPWTERWASGPIGMLWNLAGPAVLEIQSLSVMLTQAGVVVCAALISWVVLILSLRSRINVRNDSSDCSHESATLIDSASAVDRI